MQAYLNLKIRVCIIIFEFAHVNLANDGDSPQGVLPDRDNALGIDLNSQPQGHLENQ